MLRTFAAAALLLVGCTEKNGAAPDAGTSPPASVLPPGFRAPTIKCVFEMPSGWTLSASPMPDQIAEMIATAPKLHGRMVLREAIAADVSEAAEAQKQRTQASWGAQPDFTLLREDPMGEGRLLAYQWRRQPSAPVERHLIAVLPIEGKVVLASVDDDGATAEAQLLATLSTLKCSPK